MKERKMKMDNLFKKFILGFINELNTSYDFKISTDRILSIFKVYGNYDFFDETEIRNVLQSLLCQKQEEQHIFNKAFAIYFKDIKENINSGISDDIVDGLIKQQIQNEERIAMEKAEFSARIHDQEKLTDSVIEKLKEAVDNINSNDKVMLFNILIKDGAQLYEICRIENKFKKKLLFIIEQELQDIMIYAIQHELGKDVTDAVLDSLKTLTSYINDYKDMSAEHENSQKDISMKIIKVTSKKHRETYIDGHNAVQTEYGYLYKDFRQLNDKDLNSIREYVKRNALNMKTKIAMAIKKKKQKKLNYRATMKEAAKTDMYPMKLIYKSKKKEKTKIICITDISGSCKNATEILMTFIYALQEAFPGGVESYVFVKQLKDATDIFRTYSLKEANERASVLVERDYSDYFKAFSQFDTEYFERITNNTIVIYLGDARNNKNNSGEEFLDKVRNKVKSGHGKMYWLNPEPKCLWNTGDSIMNIYSKYMDISASVCNTKELINFINNMF